MASVRSSADQAIDALQEEVRRLEEENRALRGDGRRLSSLITETNEKKFAEYDKFMQASDGACQRIEEAVEVIGIFSEITEENRKLRAELEELEGILSKETDKQAALNEKLEFSKSKLKQCRRDLEKYEESLSCLLTSPSFRAFLPPNSPLLLASGKIPKQILFPEVSSLIDDLNSLPKPFLGQDKESKLRILRGLLEARDISLSLVARLRQSQKCTDQKSSDECRQIILNLIAVSDGSKLFGVIREGL